MNKVAIVNKCTDFTEGKGPFVLHKVFKNFQLAESYVMQQGGIFGSKQPDKPSVHSDEYWYNGYIIKMVPVLDSILSKEEIEKKQKEIEELQNKLNQLKAEIK